MLVFRGLKVVSADAIDDGRIRLLLEDLRTRSREKRVVTMYEYQQERKRVPGSKNETGGRS